MRGVFAAMLPVHGLAHITGGGIGDNLSRILPPGTQAVLQRGTWHEPPIFGLIERAGGVTATEMFRVFNMGLGYLLVVPPDVVGHVQDALFTPSYIVGAIEAEGEADEARKCKVHIDGLERRT
jgi:phosphoribosylformylglycinamidine cyclo-ligase